ncbi:MAG TPA: polysaccharide biosynthesis tyrosine autokinase, partial [Candidatus Eisenbacteria bacterium]|nr:polysaccharide biosynthesis tyrosine autokinase [Candidatus Eisenbacteria bacterium]
LIAACAAVVVLCAGLYVLTRTPLYTAQATIMIEPKPPQVLKIQDALSQSIERAEYYKTQYEILKSRPLAAAVIKQENLGAFLRGKSAEEKSGLIATVRGIWSDTKASLFGGAEKEAAAGPADVDPALIAAYLDILNVKPIRGTALVQVSFTTPDPTVSARLANLHADAYVRHGLDLRSKTNDEALAFLEKKLLDLKTRVETSEAALNAYRRDAGIISLNDKENIVVDRLADLNKRLTEAEAERIALEAQVRTIRSGNYDTIPAIANSLTIQNLKKEMSKLESEHAQLANEFKPGFPQLDKVRAQIDDIRGRYLQEVKSEIKTIEAAYRSAVTKEAELKAAMNEQKKAALDLKDSAVQYAILAREVETNKQLYDGVLQRIKEMGVAADVRASNVYVIEKAFRPNIPSYPNKKRTLLFALLLGLSGGVAAAFFLERLDSTFKSGEDLERYTMLPSLAAVPDFVLLNGKNQGYGYGLKRLRPPKANGAPPSRGADGAGDEGRELVLARHPLSVVSEAYRTLRSALLLSRAGEPPRTVLLVSASRGEGKTTTVVNTAAAFAQMGGKVLIIDGDLRRPRCHKLLGIENDVGLTEVLAGQIDVKRATRRTKVDGLFLIPAGTCPPNPSELLGSTKMLQTLQALREEYEYVFIDSSPILAVSDAILMATMVDGVLFVVDGQQTPRRIVKEARSRLSSPRIKMLGTLLNRVDTREGSYAKYYGYYQDYYANEPKEL